MKVGRHRFSLTGPTKSLEGCAAMLLFSVLGTALPRPLPAFLAHRARSNDLNQNQGESFAPQSGCWE